MKKVLSLLFLLFALNSVCVAEIMEDYRIAASSLIRDAAAPIAAIGSIANMNIGSYVIEFMSKSIKMQKPVVLRYSLTSALTKQSSTVSLSSKQSISTSLLRKTTLGVPYLRSPLFHFEHP
jgi:hypothetical protein